MATKKTPKTLAEIPDIEEESTAAKDSPPVPQPFTIPLKELDVGKSGVSDLFAKINEVILYLNALKSKPITPTKKSKKN